MNEIENNVVGKINYIGYKGDIAETIEFDNKEEYLTAIKKELYYNIDGFRAITLSKDPELRKSVDDLMYDAFGVDNPHSIEHYKDISSEEDNFE